MARSGGWWGMSETKLKVGVMGLHHDHVWWNLEELVATGEAELVGAADPSCELLEKYAGIYGGETSRDYGELLEKGGLDAVYVFANNRDGAEVAALAAGRGVHVFIEKPLAAGVEGADAVVEASSSGGGRVMVNWPFAWWGAMQKALAMAAGGEIGRVWQVRYRAAHQGPKEHGCTEHFYEWLYDEERNGGGALMDYCCYGAALARLLLGVPEQVTAASGNYVRDYLAMEDNAVLLMQYAKGMAVAEASWSQIGVMTSYVTVICGTEGTLLVEPGEKGRLLLATDEVLEGAVVEVGELAPELASGSAHFLSGLTTGREFMELCSLEVGRDAQAILAAGKQAAEGGRAVGL